MGLSDLLALGSLVASVAGGTMGALWGARSQCNALHADLRLIEYRLSQLEKQGGNSRHV